RRVFSSYDKFEFSIAAHERFKKWNLETCPCLFRDRSTQSSGYRISANSLDPQSRPLSRTAILLSVTGRGYPFSFLGARRLPRSAARRQIAFSRPNAEQGMVSGAVLVPRKNRRCTNLFSR